MANFDKVFTVKKGITPEEFLRQVMIDLSSDSKSPTDVMEAEFGEVRETVKEIIMCDAHVETDYSASIGYDRKEEYWDKEKKSDGHGGYYYQDVKKTRTVTDWQPHSGHTSGDALGLAYNDESEQSPLAVHDALVPLIKELKEDNMIEKGSSSVSSGGLKAAKRVCAFHVELGIRYPGDHYKDSSAHSDVTVKALTCFRVPAYEVEYQYNGETFKAVGLAITQPNSEPEIPPSNFDIGAELGEKFKVTKRIMIALFISAGVSFAAACVFSGMSIPVVHIVFWILFAVTLVAGILVAVIGNKKYEKEKTQKTKAVKQLKKEGLIAALKKKGLRSLDPKESRLFE